MTDRTTLALAACAGLDDAELAKRGPQGFKKMIERKRKYAAAARLLAAGLPGMQKTIAKQQAEIEKLKVQNKILQAQVETLESYSLPAGDDTSAAAQALASIAAKKD